MKSNAYPPLDGLFDLACRDGVDIRPTLLRVLTDLYVQKPSHSVDEETQYVELALGLIAAVDAPTRAAVAASLAAYPAAPPAILSKLAISPAPLVSEGPVRADAERQAMPEPKPAAKPKSGPATDNLIEIFFAADSAERRLILTNLDAAAATSARLAQPVSSDVIQRLESAALQRHHGEFSLLLQRALGIGRELADRIAHDPSGEPIVVAAKALGMTAAALQRIQLIFNPAIGQSIGRIYELAGLFDELTHEAAERMVAIWRKTAPTSRPVHEPAHWDDERRSARSLSTPAQHRAVRGRDRPSERFRSNGR